MFDISRRETRGEWFKNASIKLLFTYQGGIRTERENISHNRENAEEFKRPERHQHCYMMTNRENDIVADWQRVGRIRQDTLTYIQKRELKQDRGENAGEKRIQRTLYEQYCNLYHGSAGIHDCHMSHNTACWIFVNQKTAESYRQGTGT